jgi:hypothetical protein
MQFHVYRPDAKKPNELHVGFDQETFDFVLGCLDQQYQALDRLVVGHSECDRMSDFGCNVTKGNCYDDLALIHDKQTALIRIMKDARIVREHPEAKDADSFRLAQEEARRAREVALRTFEPTATYDVIKSTATHGAEGSDDNGAASGERRREVDPDEVTRIQTMVQQELGTGKEA